MLPSLPVSLCLRTLFLPVFSLCLIGPNSSSTLFSFTTVLGLQILGYNFLQLSQHFTTLNFPVQCTSPRESFLWTAFACCPQLAGKNCIQSMFWEAFPAKAPFFCVEDAKETICLSRFPSNSALESDSPQSKGLCL